MLYLKPLIKFIIEAQIFFFFLNFVLRSIATRFDEAPAEFQSELQIEILADDYVVVFVEFRTKFMTES